MHIHIHMPRSKRIFYKKNSCGWFFVGFYFDYANISKLLQEKKICFTGETIRKGGRRTSLKWYRWISKSFAILKFRFQQSRQLISLLCLHITYHMGSRTARHTQKKTNERTNEHTHIRNMMMTATASTSITILYRYKKYIKATNGRRTTTNG